MVHETGYYKPKLTRSSSPDRIADMPENWQRKLNHEHYPAPKFQVNKKAGGDKAISNTSQSL